MFTTSFILTSNIVRVSLELVLSVQGGSLDTQSPFSVLNNSQRSLDLSKLHLGGENMLPGELHVPSCSRDFERSTDDIDEEL